MLAKKNNHEELTVPASNYLVRQDRYNADVSMHIECEHGRLEVRNYSCFGVAVECDFDIAEHQPIREAKFYVNGQMISEISLEVRRKYKNGSTWQYGLETLTGSIPVEQIQVISELSRSIQLLEDRDAATKDLGVEFRCSIQDLSSRLQSYEQLVKSFEAKPYSNKGERDVAMEALVEYMARKIFEDIRDTNHGLQKLVEFENHEILKKGLVYFRDRLGRFIFQSPFTKRSFEKPRGYAGDFEMMNQVYRNDGFAGSLFGSCMERAVNLHEEPQAVRNRAKYLAEKIISKVHTTGAHEEIKVLSVASGPAQEVKYAIEALSQEQLNKVSFNLLDQDEDALKYAQRNIRSHAMSLGKRVHVNLIRKSIKQVLVEGLGEKGFSLIYSAGLFDYFTDPVATRAARTLANGLTPDGKLVIGNFNITTPNWFGMLSLFDWQLILRSEQDLARIFTIDGFRMNVEAEPENVNLFCVLDRSIHIQR